MDRPAPVGFSEALRFWLKLGCISFGGPAGQIALMHTELVERRRWISERRFLHALNYCMVLPGPEAQQLATYIGWLLHRTAAVIAAGLVTWFTFLPSFAFILAGGPLVEATQGELAYTAPLTAITAAVVGVICSLALTFGIHVWWPEGIAGRFEWPAALIAGAATLALQRLRQPPAAGAAKPANRLISVR